MFEFHGWAVVRYHAHDTDDVLQEQCWRALEQRTRLVDTNIVRMQSYNGCDSLLVFGQYNHRSEDVIELFRWVGANAPGSYGILYVRDDEDISDAEDHTNEFRVWRLCRGNLTEQADPFLSPFVPTVEDSYDESRDD